MLRKARGRAARPRRPAGRSRPAPLSLRRKKRGAGLPEDTHRTQRTSACQQVSVGVRVGGWPAVRLLLNVGSFLMSSVVPVSQAARPASSQ